jgi:N-acetylneuraminate synthase
MPYLNEKEGKLFRELEQKERQKQMNFKNLNKTYLIAEIGINHNGSVEFVKKIIDYAKLFDWDCVKLQKHDPDISVPEEQKSVIKNTPWGKMTYLEYKKKIEFSRPQYDEIACYARKQNIDFTASVWDVPSCDFMRKYYVPFIKIPSAHLINYDLLSYATTNYNKIILSTGMNNIKQIDHAVHFLKSFYYIKPDSYNYSLLHCNSSYPAAINELNLKMIQTLKDRYDCAVGYSGHEFGLATTIAAVVLGAKIIERHVTLDRTLWGTDQMCSIEPQGMLKLSQQIRATEKALGNGIKKVYSSELPNLKKMRIV